MFRSTHFRWLALAFGLTSAVAAGFAAEDTVAFLLAAAAGVVVGLILATRITAGVMREIELFARRLRRGAVRDEVNNEAVPEAPLFVELADAVEEVVQNSRTRKREFERREGELEQNSALLETVLGTMVEAVLVVDARSHVLFANRAFRSLLSIERDDLAGRPLVEIVRAPQIQEAVREALFASAPVESEFEIGRQQKIVALTAAALSSARFRGVVLVLHDVTELRRLERMRRDFVSNVSHELKTPLTSIQAYAHTLLDGALDDAEHNRQFLDRIVQQTERLQSLIMDLLSLAKIESQPEAFEIQPVAVDETIRACVDAHAAVADAKSIRLTCAQTPPLKVLADPDGLRQILDNLVDNALNYTPAGGEVSIRCGRDREWCVISVQDSGIGISRDQQRRIFERFYRADRARSRDVGGTGLGLAIVKHLTQAFDGRVAVESELERGSTFHVTLPLAGEAARTAQ